MQRNVLGGGRKAARTAPRTPYKDSSLHPRRPVRPLKDLVHEVRLELSDASPLRLSRKEKVWVDWLQKRGYASLGDVRVGDEWGLGKVLDEFEVINRRGGP